MKHLIIQNFGPIEAVDLELKRINLIIGPQSSGKSCVLKVACYCDWVERQIVLSQTPERYCTTSAFLKNLVEFHKLEGYLHPQTFISYESEYMSFTYSEEAKACTFAWKENKRWGYKRVKISYIPSERNLVAAIPNWYQVSMNRTNILDFMKEWEFARKSFSKGQQILGLPFQYKYQQQSQSDRIIMSNNQELDLTNASSGLQSLTPLYIMLCYLTHTYFNEPHTTVEESMRREALQQAVAACFPGKTEAKQQDVVTSLLTVHHAELYIEEPEAYIFPSTQKDFVYHLSEMLNGRRKHHCFITTHSPYIMTSINNLLLAADKMEQLGVDKEAVKRVIPSKCVLKFDEVSAYSLANGKAQSIMDEEFRIISADALDQASSEISNDFNALLSL